MLRRVKLIAEPWDVGHGGYQVGEFPPLWTEWNDKYRDTVRDFWRGATAGHRRARLAAHRVVRPVRRRRPPAVRVHQLRHRPRRVHPARPRHLRRTSTTRPTARATATAPTTTAPGTTASRARRDDPTITRRRRRHDAQHARDLAAVHRGPDAARAATRWAAPSSGNNNAYCQDNEISWLDWDLDPWQGDLLEFARRLLATAARPPGAPAPALLRGPVHDRGRREGPGLVRHRRAPSSPTATGRPGTATLGMYLSGATRCASRPAGSSPSIDSSFLLLLHAGTEPARPSLLPGAP